MQRNSPINIRYLIPAGTLVLLVILMVIAAVTYLYRAKQAGGNKIADDVALLAEKLQEIHEQCTIIEFDFQKNPINFLTVQSFVGSQVGPMNLAHPEKWKGPYLTENPSVQNIEYEVIRTRKGYYVTPGQGVKLPNGKIIGKDIVLDVDADINALVNQSHVLWYNKRPLAAQIHVKQSIFSLDDF